MLVAQPITDVTSNDLICNGGINPYLQPVSKAIIDVPAGGQVTAEWHHTLNSAGTGDAADPIDASHKGPVMAYLYGLFESFFALHLNMTTVLKFLMPPRAR